MVNLSIDFALEYLPMISQPDTNKLLIGITNHVISEIENLRQPCEIKATYSMVIESERVTSPALGNHLQVLERRYKTIFSQGCISTYL